MHFSNTEMVLMAPKLAPIATNAHRPIIPRVRLCARGVARQSVWSCRTSSLSHSREKRASRGAKPQANRVAVMVKLLPPEWLLCLAAESRSSEADVLEDVIIKAVQPG
jgi:hypothetical protein